MTERPPMTPLEIAREMVSLADHQHEQFGRGDSEADRVARELIRLHEALLAWRSDVDAAYLDHGWQIIERIDELLAHPTP